MPKLANIARILRSKNAGPFTLTIDIIFGDADCFKKALPLIDKEAIAKAYNIDPSEVEVLQYPPANAIKINIPRLVPSGHPGDTDVYGAQQHAPLLDYELAIEC